ncbi:hypothetical protein [Kitasatospora herbaricolor]|uniref:hypothetical protein n=2 Tax=Kitasatospora herbaricolor TaxID=68217 RepID=UPI0036DB377F
MDVRGLRRGAGAVGLVLAACAGALTGVLPVATATAATAAQGELVLPAAPRGLPAHDQLYVAGDTGLLHAREGSDHLLWTRYDTGATTDTGLRLPAPLDAGLSQGVPWSYLGRPDSRYGTSSDTVAVPVAATGDAPAKVVLHSLAGGSPAAAGTVEIPAGQTYYGTYGRTVLTFEGSTAVVTGWYLNRLEGGSVVRTKVALPAGAELATSVQDGDQTSLILRHRFDGTSHSVLVDLATGATTALPDEAPYAFTYSFRLAKGAVLRAESNVNNVDVLDRAQPRTVLSSTYVNGTSSGELRLLGGLLLTTESTVGSSGDNRGRPLLSSVVGSTTGIAQQVLPSAGAQLLPAPDGSLLAVGSTRAPEQGQPETAVLRLGTDGSAKPVVGKLADVPPAPAKVFGFSIGGGVLTVASDTVHYQPGDITGAYRSYRLSGDATPVQLSQTLDGPHRLNDCMSHSALCVPLRSTGDGRYLPEKPVVGDQAVALKAGSQESAATVPTGGVADLETMDAAGRYVVLAQNPYGNWQKDRPVVVGDLDTGSRLLQANLTAAAVGGDTLWTSKQGTTTVTATDVRASAYRDSFTTPCVATQLEAVGRLVYWGCQDAWGTLRTSGVFDTVTRYTLSVPVQATDWGNNWSGPEAQLGNGYLVRQDLAGGRLVLIDLRDGIRASGGENSVEVRTLASGDYWKTIRSPRKHWAVDRSGSNVVWADDDFQRLHVLSTAPAAEAGNRFTAVGPDRLLDTRAGVGRPGTDPVPAGGEVTLQVSGRSGVPASGVKAVVLNVTVTDPKTDGHLTVWPSGKARPDSSNLNWVAGRTVPNQVVVPVGADGRVKLYNAAWGSAHLIADVFGYYTQDQAGSTFSAVGPDRLLDTRAGVGRPGTDPVPAGGEVALQVSGRSGVPASGVKAVVLNVTVTDPKTDGHLTVWPSGAARPDSSNLNWVAGQTVPNHVTVPVGADGRVKLYNAGWGSAHLIADVFGYFSDDPAGAVFRSSGPQRLLDTRAGQGAVPAGGQLQLDVSGAVAGAKAVVLNVTVTDPKSDGHLTVWPSGAARPDSSNLNWVAGQTVPNLVTVPVGADGRISLANLGWGSAQVIVDLFGSYA